MASADKLHIQSNQVSDQQLLTQARSYIANLDFSKLIHKLIQHQGWNRAEATKLCEVYKNFLFLKKKYGDEHQLPPTEEIDEFWHEHILDTQQYRQDCLRIFGYYLDHYPYLGIDDRTDFNDLDYEFRQTLSLYKKEFGVELVAIKSIFSPLMRSLRKLFLRKPKGYKITQQGATHEL